MVKRSFTLVELVIVIFVIGIMAVAAHAKLSKLISYAKAASDDAVIGALQSAIILEHAKRVAEGENPDEWYTGNPFELLTNPPPYKLIESSYYYVGDGKNWALVGPPIFRFSQYYWQIFCPHCVNIPYQTKGNKYAYVCYEGSGQPTGKIVKLGSGPHE